MIINKLIVTIGNNWILIIDLIIRADYYFN